jgi:hypothetical protein
LVGGAGDVAVWVVVVVVLGVVGAALEDVVVE